MINNTKNFSFNNSIKPDSNHNFSSIPDLSYAVNLHPSNQPASGKTDFSQKGIHINSNQITINTLLGEYCHGQRKNDARKKHTHSYICIG